MTKMTKRKQIKKKVSILLALCICMTSMSVYAMESDTMSETEIVQMDYTEEINELPTWVSWAKTAIKWMIYKIDHAVYNVSASKEEGSNYIRVSSGSIDYNNGTNGSSSYIDVVARSNFLTSGNPNLSISLSVSCSFLTGLTDVMAVTLTNPSGSYVINTTLGRNGVTAHGVTQSSAQGTYRATYAVTKNQKWTSTATVFDGNAPATRTMTDDNQEEIVINWAENKYYLIPSSDDTMKVSSDLMQQDDRVLNVDELYEQFWDSGLNDYTYVLKDFSVGDCLNVSDTIINMTYDADQDRTILEFATRRGNAYWPFDGNLMEQYEIGDSVAFKFNVVEEYSNSQYVFESLDYFQKAEDRLFDSEIQVEIEDYLK